MSKFMGGSAFSLARDIAEGYFSVTDRTFKSMTPAEMNQLGMEIDRYLRELRSEQNAKDETTVIQARNRKIQRMTSAMMVLRTFRQKNKV